MVGLREWIKYNLSFLGALNSPLKGLRLKWYFGEIVHGTPYFLPRKWVKMTEADCKESLKRDLDNAEKHGWKFGSEKKWENYKNSKKPIPIKYFGINWNTLGWKTKWEDYRFEYNPGLSIVLFGKQLYISIQPKTDSKYWDSYWEAWLNYKYNTDKKLTVEERFKELLKVYSCTWTSYSATKDKVCNDHYPFILKNKYLKLYNGN